jgi:diguanylate cyclase (GGDEF)-like protein
VLLGGLCLVVARHGERSRALRLWGLGLLCYAAGLLTTLLTVMPVDIAKVVGNTLIAVAPIFTVAGLLAHTQVRLSRAWIGALTFVTLAILLANHLRTPYSVAVDMLTPAPLANILFLYGAIVLLRRPPADAAGPARFLAGILFFCIALWTVRIGMIWMSLGGTNDRERTDLTVAAFVIGQLLIVVASTLGLFWVEVRRSQAALLRVANTDGLTGIANRRATMARFDEEAARAARSGRPFSIAIFDVDHFKRVNDTYGHGTGDATLRYVAQRLGTGLRAIDAVGRIGGEEFVVLLAGEGPVPAFETADRLREIVAAEPLVAGGGVLSITLSGGVATFPEDGSDWDRLFNVADRRLYAAKRDGRNRVVGAFGTLSGEMTAGTPSV